MKSLKKVIFIFILITTVFFANMATAQVFPSIFPFTSPLSILSPIASFPQAPLPIASFPTFPSFLPIARTAQIPTATTIAAPVLITTNWSGVWTSFLNTNQFGPMALTITEDLSAGTFTGTLLLDLNSLVPVSIPVSGAYTGVGLDISVSGFYSGLVPVTTGGGPFAVTVLVPADFLITLDFNIVGGVEIIGTYSIVSTVITDFGSIYLTIL